jgi:hypothetical protein
MIHYVCVATESKLYFPYLKKLIPDLVVLGMNMEWTGFIMKYDLLVQYLKTLNDDDIVCFIDAYDVLPTKNIIHLENKFINFSNENPDIKMIVGGEGGLSKIQQTLSNIYFKNNNLNSGTYIGYTKNILFVLSSILKKKNIYDDQIELIKYAKKKPNDIFVDNNNDFFCVVTSPLQQAKLKNNRCSFIHANGNGLLEDFLDKHHNIECSLEEKIKNYTTHLNIYFSKGKMYIKTFLLNN